MNASPVAEELDIADFEEFELDVQSGELIICLRMSYFVVITKIFLLSPFFHPIFLTGPKRSSKRKFKIKQKSKNQFKMNPVQTQKNKDYSKKSGRR